MNTIPTRFVHIATWAVALFAAAIADGQNEPRSRNVKGQEKAAGKRVQINEVNTDQFPKVRLFVTVDENGVAVKGLAASDFRVREDEVDQEPLTVEPKLPPLSVIITMDTSGSMSKRLKDAQTAAIGFLDLLGESDSAQVVSFAREVKKLSSMTTSRATLRDSIMKTVARGDTALYDALYESIALLKERLGRKAIVLLSDGVDDDGKGGQLSKHSVREVLALARQVNVPIFVVGVGTELDEGTLTEVAEQTGGLYLKTPQASQLKELYGRIGEQLAGQYAIRYTSNLPADGTDHAIKLEHDKIVSVKVYKAPLALPPPPSRGAEPQPKPTPAIVVEEPPITGEQDTEWENVTVRINYLKRSGKALYVSYTYTSNLNKSVGHAAIYAPKQLYCVDSATKTKYPVIVDDDIPRCAYPAQGWIDEKTTKTISAALEAPPADVTKVTVHIPNAMPFVGVSIQNAVSDGPGSVKRTEWDGVTIQLKSAKRDGTALQVAYSYKNSTKKSVGHAALGAWKEFYCVDPVTNAKFPIVMDDKRPRVLGLSEGWISDKSVKNISATFVAPPPGTNKLMIQLPCAEPFLEVPIQE